MTKHSTLIVLLLALPFSVGAAGLLETTAGPNTFTARGTADRPVLASRDGPDKVQGLTVHEWGTFTSVAGREGTSIDWLPAGGPTDLPCFVNVSGAGPKPLLISEQGGRAARAMVRMETPVLYFYAPKETTVNVKVSFPRGLMTEWYPQANLGPTNQWEAMKNFPAVTSTIEWDNVKVRPGATEKFPLDAAASHYYAARKTGSAPLQVGTQHEKFLFYRGLASFTPPISVQATSSGQIAVTNIGAERIPGIILFENRGGRLGYRVHGEFASQQAGNPQVAAPLILDLPQLTGSVESLQKELEGILQAQGMYSREARAMVDTWKDTWFEQGTRVFYIVPPAAIDAILPLEITPKPLSVARAFAGRMEVITPATQEEVRVAITKEDTATLQAYGRFLEPILNDFLAKGISDADRSRGTGMMQSIRAGYIADAAACKQKRSW